MTRDSVMLPAGCVAQQYTDQDGNDIERTALVAHDGAGHARSSANRVARPGSLELGDAVSIDEFLEHIVESVDSLSPLHIDSELMRSLAAGAPLSSLFSGLPLSAVVGIGDFVKEWRFWMLERRAPVAWRASVPVNIAGKRV